MESKFIIIEGVDGSGKTTMIKDLKEDIKARDKNIKVFALSLPYSRCFAYNKIRDVLSGGISYPADVFQSLYVANMIEAAEKFINPFFEKNPENGIVIMDRSIISTLVYNSLCNGSLYQSIRTFLRKKRLDGDKSIHEDDTILDLDIINNKYGQLNKTVDHYYFLIPPIDIVADRATARHSKEEFDGLSFVNRTYRAYEMMHKFLTGHLYRTAIDILESPDGMLKPNMEIAHKITKLDIWNRTVDPSENHRAYREIVLHDLGL